METTRLRFAICCVSIILLTSITASARVWRGIVPLQSTRQDVERLLGVPSGDYYDLKNEIVYIDFSTGTCPGAGPASYKVPADTVTRIMVITKSEPLLDSLGVDISKYKKDVDGDLQEHIFYNNEEAGESIETFQNRIQSMTYSPLASESSLRCYSTVEEYMTANNLVCVLPSRKFDEFEAVSSDDERARLENVVIQLKSGSPLMRAWIVIHGTEKGGRAAALRRAKRIKGLLVHGYGLESRRVLTSVSAKPDGPRVTIWLTPVGHILPSP
jgi:hypothetical protein